MEEYTPSEPPELAAKIARLVEERGWNQEEFARIARVNRHTARQILLGSADRSLRNSTILACAKALGLSVSDLRGQALEKLLPLMREGQPSDGEAGLRGLVEQAVQPELVAWLERNPDRARRLSLEDRNELLALQGATGPLKTFGVEGFVQRLERRRKIIERIHAIAGTEYLDLLEQIVNLIHDKVQPGFGSVASGNSAAWKKPDAAQ
jgi:transcriptional regulator with XRE-family HTH domain